MMKRKTGRQAMETIKVNLHYLQIEHRIVLIALEEENKKKLELDKLWDKDRREMMEKIINLKDRISTLEKELE